MASAEVNRTVIHWFRKGQRIHDNPALHKACELIKTNSDFVFRPIFILDPKILEWMTVGANRFRFLQESLTQLNENLATINSRLYVIRGNPTEVFPRILKEWNVAVLSFETDIEPYALKRDEEITKMAEKQGTIIISESSHTIYNPERVLLKNLGKVPMQYQKFMSIVQQLPVSEPYQTPDVLPKRSIPSKDSFETENPNCYDPPLLEEVVRNMKDLGPNKYPGGETQALRRMEKYLKQTDWICAFEKPNTSPNSIEPSTTVLSPYFKFGCLSSRLFYKKLKEVLAMHPKHSQPPVSLIGQMMWREFYYTAAAGEPNFDRMVGNSICLQIPWQKNDDHLKAWTYGQTGYPFIDAIMRQLRQEGWIHHLARHAVACFLTRGDLWISWEEGQKVFEELLLDADWALNAGNWMWLSASAFFYKYFRVYSPVAFGKKTDPEGLYIRKYVPELTKYPAGIIFEPWKASLAAQKEYGCVIGKDYPHRIVIHEEIHKHNLLKMKEAYKKNRELKSGTIDDSETVASSSQKRKMESSPGAIGRNAKKVSKGTTAITKFFKKK